MPERKLRQLLAELQDELARTREIDAETADLLEGAKDELEEALERQGEAPTARERLDEAVRRLERKHPDGVALLERVLEALANVGI